MRIIVGQKKLILLIAGFWVHSVLLLSAIIFPIILYYFPIIFLLFSIISF